MVFQQLQFSIVSQQGINDLYFFTVHLLTIVTKCISRTLWQRINGLLIGGALMPYGLLWKPPINAPRQVNPCRFQSYGTHCVDLWESTIISEELTTSIFRIVSKPLIVHQHSSWAPLNFEALSFSKILVNCNQSTQHHIPEDWNLHQHHCSNLTAQVNPRSARWQVQWFLNM
jgi:hypothetical protein